MSWGSIQQIVVAVTQRRALSSQTLSFCTMRSHSRQSIMAPMASIAIEAIRPGVV